MNPALPEGGAAWMVLCMACTALAVGIAIRQGRGKRLGGEASGRRLASAGGGLPWVWRLTLPGLRRMSWCARPVLGWHSRPRLETLLQSAGLASVLDPLVLRTAQCLLTALAMLVGIAAMLLQEAAAASAWYWLGVAAGALAAWHWPCLRLVARARERRRQMSADLPLVLEMLALCLAGGQHFNGAMQQIARHAPRGALHQEFLLALAEISQGRSRVDAIRLLARRTGLPALRRFAAVLAQADGLGMALGPLLRAQARQMQDERFQRAEKQAMEAPVKMLLPLMTCIFPCTFLVLAYPIMHYLQPGAIG